MSESKVKKYTDGVLMLRVPVQLLTGEGEGKFKEMGENVIAQTRKACEESGLSLIIIPASTDNYGNHLYDIKEC